MLEQQALVEFVETIVMVQKRKDGETMSAIESEQLRQ
jgi:hypothetical protein